jgi:hypothetical protein
MIETRFVGSVESEALDKRLQKAEHRRFNGRRGFIAGI